MTSGPSRRGKFEVSFDDGDKQVLKTALPPYSVALLPKICLANLQRMKIPGHDVRLVDLCPSDDRSDLSTPSPSPSPPPLRRDPAFRARIRRSEGQSKPALDSSVSDDGEKQVRLCVFHWQSLCLVQMYLKIPKA